MSEKFNALEALKFISDWAKWLITIETASIAIIGSLFTSDKITMNVLANILGTFAIVCFLLSIIAAAILLLTLPEIAQFLRDDTNIWLTRDNIAGNFFKLNTQTLAIIESFFFGLGMVLSSALIITAIWS
jgi:uncharacterized membrane protein YedE/YeeE